MSNVCATIVRLSISMLTSIVLVSTFYTELQAAEDIHDKVRSMYRNIVDKFVADANTTAKLYKTIDETSKVVSIMNMTANTNAHTDINSAIMAFSLDFSTELMERMAIDAHEREQNAASRNALEKIRLCRETTRKGAHKLDDLAFQLGNLELRQLVAALQEEKNYALEYYVQRTGQNIAPSEKNRQNQRDNESNPVEKQDNAIVAEFFQRHAPAPTQDSNQNPPVWRMNDELYTRLQNDQKFLLADSALNATWAILKVTIPANQFQKIQKQHKEWIASGRDKAASRLGAKLSQADAYAQATWEHTDKLASLVASSPQLGEYRRKDNLGYLAVTWQERSPAIRIETSSESGNGLCAFENSLKPLDVSSKGWVTIQDQEETVLLLFAGNRVHVLTPGTSSFCGAGAYLDGLYEQR